MTMRNWRLRHKVVLHVVVLGSLGAAVLAALYVTTQRRVLYAFSEERAALVGSLIKNSVFLLKKCGRVEDTEEKIHELIVTTGTIKSLRILTLEGRIFASTPAEEKDSLLEPVERERVKDMFARRISSRTIFSGPGRTIRSLMLVENKPDCYGCHSSANDYNGFLEVSFTDAATASLLWRSQKTGILLAGLTLGLLAFIILRLFEKLINRPLTMLKDKMKRVQEGDLSVRLSTSREDEIGSLTKSFNVMVEHLDEANRKIEELYARRLEKAEQLAAFGELAAGLAHEVKNPLSGIKGALEILGQKTEASDPGREIYREMLLQIDLIISVIQDFLAYARPKAPQFSLVPPSLFIRNAIRLAETQLDGKDVEILFRPAPDEVPVRLDPDKMQQVILNLLLNAISAAGERGRISIESMIVPGQALNITVSDNGSGIKEPHLAQIFNPFFSTKQEGTGLGLSISKKIVEAHNGTIRVESREGIGTSFFISLPLDDRGR